jgi:CHAT domain-containing protein
VGQFRRTGERAALNRQVPFLACALVALAGCSRPDASDAVEIYAARRVIDGSRPATLAVPLEQGTYLVEVRERDVDVRTKISVDGKTATLEGRLPRQGVVFRLIKLDAPRELGITVTSFDHPTKRGEALVRVSRWSRMPAEPWTEREIGYAAQSTAAELSTVGTYDSWKAAAAKLSDAVAHFEAAHDDRAVAEAAYALADIDFGPLDRFEAALRACDVATAAFHRLGDEVAIENVSALRAAAEIDLAYGLSADEPHDRQRKLFDDAESRLARAEGFFAERGLRVRAQYTVNMRAVRAIESGDYDTAAVLFTRAADMALANADVRERARSLGNLGVVHLYLGLMEQAAREYEALLPLIDGQQQPYQYASFFGNYGIALAGIGDFDRALEAHKRSLEIYTRLGEEDERADQLSHLGFVYLRMGDATRAMDILRTAIAVEERQSNAQDLAATLRFAARAASTLGDHIAALAYLRRSIRIETDLHATAQAHILIAGEWRKMGDLQAATAELAGPLSSSIPLVLANAIEERAQIRLGQRDAREAIKDLRDAGARYAALGLEINQIDTYTVLARSLLETGDISGAREAVDRAIVLVNRIRLKTASPEWRAKFLSSRYSPYEVKLAIDFASADPDAAWHAFRTAEAIRARALSEEISVSGNAQSKLFEPKEVQLRSRLTALELRLESRMQKQEIDDQTVVLRRAIIEARTQLDALHSLRGIDHSGIALPESMERAQSALPAGTAVLAYFVGDREGHAWLMSRGTFRHIQLPSRESLERSVSAVIREQQTGKIGNASRSLSQLILGPVLDGLDAERLLVLEDGPLHGISFAALPLTHGGGDLLVDRFVISNAPSLMLASRPRQTKPPRLTVAVVSDAVYADDDRRLPTAQITGKTGRTESRMGDNLERLRYSREEARSVMFAFRREKVIELSGFEANAARITELPSSELSVLHFATHAAAPPDDPGRSALMLSRFSSDGTRLAMDRLTVYDLARSGLRADLVVLSGCSTGGGRPLRGEGVLGLTHQFLANGSNTVIASLWPVEDALTARFMAEFYAAYRATGRAADALRTAQLRIRGTAAAPVWASFVVRANALP